MTAVTVFQLWVPGDVPGKERARVTRHGHAYTPAKTRTAERHIQQLWRAAGSPRLPDGPIHVLVDIWVRRPKSHWTTTGRLSAEGRRRIRPTSRPDIDNQIKLAADSLNGLAWRDDAQIVSITASRWWAHGDQQPGLWLLAQVPGHPEGDNA